MNNNNNALDKEMLERQYSPSSCVGDITPYINEYVELSQSNLNVSKQANTVLENISYGEDPDECLDLFFPTSNTEPTGKLLIYFHGGYWQELSKNESCFMANQMQQQGYFVAVVNYSLTPKISLTEIVDQCRRATAFLHLHASDYGYSPEAIYLAGSSAGAHLAMMVALTDWQVFSAALLATTESLIRGVIAVSGVYDLSPLLNTYINDAVKMDANEAQQMSPWSLISEQKSVPAIPVLFIVGEIETDTFKQQNTSMYQRWLEFGGQAEITEIGTKNHFNVIVDIFNSDDLYSKYLSNFLSC